MAAADQDAALCGQALQARFLMAGDRYAHTISLKTARGEAVILESIEGTSEEPWPPSPPLQSWAGGQGLVGQPSLARRTVAMLLGMAGQSHWSLAVELVTSPDGEWLVFDHACRAAAAPRCLGSRYRLGPGTRWDAETDRLVSPSGSARLRVDASALVPVLASPSELEIAPRSAPLVTPSIPSTVAYPATIRWRYSIEVATPER